MPNMSKIPLCPYYHNDKQRSITCEDACRTFANERIKSRWLDKYCVHDWKGCRYAQQMDQAYDEFFKGDDNAIMEHEIKALKKELHNLSTKLGRAEKRNARQQKKIDELMAVNKSFVSVNNSLEEQKRDFYRQLRDAQAELAKYERHVDEDLGRIVRLYEDRIAYLIDTYCPHGRLEERTVNAWAKNKKYALTFSPTSEDPVWIVMVREAVEDGNEEQHESGRVQGVSGNAGQEDEVREPQN